MQYWRSLPQASPRLPGSCEATAYYVAAEAFANAAKHAAASGVDILIERAYGADRLGPR
jgi:signal transduction histidine kinase